MVFTVVLVALVVMAGVQTIQLISLNNKLSESGTTLSTASQNSPVASGNPSGSSRVTAPSNIQDLPQMVGGC